MPSGLVKPAVGAQINREHPLAKGLIAAWLFNERGGNKVFDYARRISDGTISGALYTPTGLKFNGVSDVVTVPILAIGSTFTFYVILRPSNLAGDSYQTVALQGGTAGFYLRNGGKMDFYYGGDHLNNTSLVQDAWSHFAASSSAGTVSFYLNALADGGSSGTTGFNLDHIGDNSFSETFAGEIAAMFFWERALTQTEIE